MAICSECISNGQAEIRALRTQLAQIKMAEIEAKPKSYRVSKVAKKMGMTKAELVGRMECLGWIRENDDGEKAVDVRALVLGWAETQEREYDIPRLRITSLGVVALDMDIKLKLL